MPYHERGAYRQSSARPHARSARSEPRGERRQPRAFPSVTDGPFTETRELILGYPRADGLSADESTR
jgi:hypothetical protein